MPIAGMRSDRLYTLEGVRLVEETVLKTAAVDTRREFESLTFRQNGDL